MCQFTLIPTQKQQNTNRPVIFDACKWPIEDEINVANAPALRQSLESAPHPPLAAEFDQFDVAR